MVIKAKVASTHPLYPPNIKSLPFKLIAEWLRLPEQFKLSSAVSLGVQRFILVSSLMLAGVMKYYHCLFELQPHLFSLVDLPHPSFMITTHHWGGAVLCWGCAM